jgi:hypothetical protein
MKPDWGYYGTYDESAHADLWDGVVGYWAPCLGPTGLRLHDVSRYSNWGTLTNMDAPTDWVIDGGQYALDFDGSNDYVLAGNWPNIPQNGSMTIAAWVYVTSTTSYRTVVTKRVGSASGANNVNYELSFDLGSTRFGFYSGTGFTPSTSNLGTNVWGLILCSVDSTGARYFLNGVADGTSTDTVGAINTAALNIGGVALGLTQQFPGRISDLVIWNRALNANEAARLYQLGRGGMLQRRRRRRVYAEQAGFRAHYRAQRAQLIGGGLR